jgi:hypothetical protein
MTTMKLRFAFEKETKGAVRFQEVSEAAIRKSALPDGKIP